MGDLTWNQRRALRNLGESRTPKTASYIADGYTRGEQYLCGSAARAAVEALVKKGLAEVSHTTFGPKRYVLTDAGWTALSAAS